MSDVTRILTAIEQGDDRAADELLPVVYAELRRLAAQRLAHEAPGLTLQPTALVHEAYLRLVTHEQQPWDGRAHFFAAAAEAMRRILIERARRKGRLKHGGGKRRLDLDQADQADHDADPLDLIALDEALEAFEQEDPEKASLVKLRFFAGLSSPEAAALLGISRSTAARHWAYARAWLYDRITHDGDGESKIDG